MSYEKYDIYQFSGFGDTITFSPKSDYDDIATAVQHTKDKKEYKIMTWGKKNNMPQLREELIEDNNVVPRLLQTRRNILIGGGLFMYREFFEGKKRKREEVEIPDVIQDMIDELDFEDFDLLNANDLVVQGNFGNVFDTLAGGKIDKIKNIRANYWRPQEMDDDGIIHNYFINGDWAKKKDDFSVIPNLVSLKKNKIPKGQFFVHTRDRFLGNEYFATPTYWTGRNWIRVSNEIPDFHIHNLENGYLVRYHIQIPKGYFFDNAMLENGATEEEVLEKEKKDKAAFLKKVDEMLSGTSNAGKAVWSEYDVSDRLQKEYGGIKITPINIDLKDKALLDLFDKTNQANISATGVPPHLAGIIQNGGLSGGAEIRNALLMYVITQALTDRNLLLKPYRILAKINGWDKEFKGYKFGYRDVEITTLDKNPTGSQGVNIS